MTREKPFDETLDEALLSEELGLDAIADVAAGLPAVAQPSQLLARVLESVRSEPRLARFGAAVARLLDVTVEQAHGLLARLGDVEVWEPGFMPGMELYHVKGGPRVANAITGFVRLREQVTFPEHEHLAEESVLILQGHCVEQGETFGPGDEMLRGPSTHDHTFTVCPGPDLVYLAVVQKGLRIGEMVVLADDPRA